MENEIVKRKFIYQLGKAVNYANNNGLSYGVFAWVCKEPFDKMNTQFDVSNTKFFMKTAGFDNKDMFSNLAFIIKSAANLKTKEK